MSASANAKARAFLSAFRITGSVLLAAEAAGVERTIHYRWLTNKGYARDFAAAEEAFADVLEATAIARAKDGVLEAVFYQGAPCGAIRKYSDGLMGMLLKRYKPAKYGTRISAELSGPGGAPIHMRDPGIAALTDAELASLIALTSKIDDARGSPRGPAGAAEEKD